MKEQTYFHIPEPCHENWDNMTPQDKGRFCASCNKQVVDFSLMSDQQVLTYFKNATGKTCGRFANDQLQRPMIEATQQKKKVWWLAAMMPLLLVFGKANAQKKIGKVKLGTSAKVIPDNRPEIMGKVAPGIRAAEDTIPQQIIITENCWTTIGDTITTTIPTYFIIKGTITDQESTMALAGASIIIKGTNIGTASDVNGNFTLPVKNIHTSVLVLSYVGYDSKEIDLTKNIDSSCMSSPIEIDLNSDLTKMQPYFSKGLAVVVGGISVCKKPKHRDTANAIVNKILKKESFKIFPNPAEKGGTVKVEIKKAGDYSIQILDNNAGLVLVKDFQTLNDNSLQEITIPSYIIAGMYYIRLIDENKKKQYTDKLIVQ